MLTATHGLTSSLYKTLSFYIFSGIFIVGAKRTAFGTYGGTLKNHSFCDLQVVASKAALQEAGIKPDQVDSVVIGNVMAVCTILLYLLHEEASLKKNIFLF